MLGNSLAESLQRGKQQAEVAARVEQDRIKGLLDLISGGTTANGSPKAGGFLSLLQQRGNQSLEAARAQAIADTQGLTAASMFDFNNTILPQIAGAAEDAGASGGALTALLAQNASAAQAGEVAKMQGNQILGQESLANQANIASQANLMDLLNTIIGQSLSQNTGVVRQGGTSGSGDNNKPDSMNQRLLDLSHSGASFGLGAERAKRELDLLRGTSGRAGPASTRYVRGV